LPANDRLVVNGRVLAEHARFDEGSAARPWSAVFMIRMKPSVKAAAEKAAEADNRSLAAYIETLLESHLRDEGYLPKSKK
jgi:hypothetical protein